MVDPEGKNRETFRKTWKFHLVSEELNSRCGFLLFLDETCSWKTSSEADFGKAAATEQDLPNLHEIYHAMCFQPSTIASH